MRRLQLAFLGLLLMASNAAARGGMPEPLTPRGKVIEGLYYQIFVAGVLVFLFVMALMAYVLIRYRASTGHGRATFEAERHNMKLELVWIIIPLAIMLWIGVISYQGLLILDEGTQPEEAHTTIDITGVQWQWIASYGAGDFKIETELDSLANVVEGYEIGVPADVPVNFRVTSTDVIHAFHIADANQATVGMVDANPSGPHQINDMVVELPAGEYHVQCREMCFNPGHGYMRAKIVAMPEAEYNQWYAMKEAEAKAPKLLYAVEVTDGGVSAPVMKTAPGVAARVQLANAAATDLTFTATTGQELLVPAGTMRFMDIQTDNAGAVQIASNRGDALAVQVVEPTLIEVELGDFYITPGHVNFAGDELYKIRVTNVGSSPHNLFLGDYMGPGQNVVTAQSDTIGGSGKTTDFYMLAGAAMTWDTWCNVPGHYGSGMVGTASA